MDYPLNPKDVQTRLLTASTLVCKAPCLLVSIVLAPVTTSGQITVYDGHTTLGEAKVYFDITKGSSLVYNPAIPIYLRDGLYVEFTTFDGRVTVEYAKMQQTE
jgi:hypothetical protein